MNFSPYHSKSRESREGTDEKVTKIYTSVGDASKKTRCHSPKIHLCLYFSNSKTRQEIHKAICSSEIAILPSTRNNNCTTLPTWLVKINMCNEYVQPVFFFEKLNLTQVRKIFEIMNCFMWYHKYMPAEDNNQ